MKYGRAYTTVINTTKLTAHCKDSVHTVSVLLVRNRPSKKGCTQHPASSSHFTAGTINKAHTMTGRAFRNSYACSAKTTVEQPDVSKINPQCKLRSYKQVVSSLVVVEKSNYHFC